MLLLAVVADIRDIKSPVNFARNLFFIYLLAALAVLAGLIVLFKFLKQRHPKQPLGVVAPDQIALEALAALKGKNLPAQGQVKEYYFQLSNIIRYYIEQRFIIRAPEMTTEEFLFSLRDSAVLCAAHQQLLKEFLGFCDVVKFAKYGPSQQEIEASYRSAVKLVAETNPAQTQQVSD